MKDLLVQWLIQQIKSFLGFRNSNYFIVIVGALGVLTVLAKEEAIKENEDAYSKINDAIDLLSKTECIIV
jgi:hypothetical protein